MPKIELTKLCPDKTRGFLLENFCYKNSGNEKNLFFGIGGCVVPSRWSYSTVDEVVQVSLPDQKLQVRFVWGAASYEVAHLSMVGAVRLGVWVCFPKLVRRLPKEGLLSDVPEKDVDWFFEDRGLRHVVLWLCGRRSSQC